MAARGGRAAGFVSRVRRTRSVGRRVGTGDCARSEWPPISVFATGRRDSHGNGSRRFDHRGRHRKLARNCFRPKFDKLAVRTTLLASTLYQFQSGIVIGR